MLFSAGSAFFISSVLGIAQPTATTAKHIDTLGKPTSPLGHALLGFLFIIAIFGGGILHLLKLGTSSVTKKPESPARPDPDPYPANHEIDDA